MKLLYCPKCCDVRKLGMKIEGSVHYGAAYCECTKSWGYYTDDINAVYGGDAVMLGIANSSLAQAIDYDTKYPARPNSLGVRFEAFIIPESAPTVKREGVES